MNGIKINGTDTKDDSRCLLLAIIQQAVEDIKKSAELYEYYRATETDSPYKMFDNTHTWNYDTFLLSGHKAIESTTHSIVIDLSYNILDNPYNFWIECIKRIAHANPHWSEYYQDELRELKKELERIKI